MAVHFSTDPLSLNSSRRKVRVLFGAMGWPSGVLEVASWAKRSGLAEALILQLQPGYAFQLDARDGTYLRPGRVDAEIVDSFMRHGRRLPIDAEVTGPKPGVWEIRDDRGDLTYRLAAGEGGHDVTIVEYADFSRFGPAIRTFAERRSVTSRLFERDGSPATGLIEALLILGGRFITRMVQFEPHVVGFRVEGGHFEEVSKCIASARLFGDVEIVLGGPTATSHARQVLEDSGADYVFAGEAEETFLQFLRLARQWNSRDRQPEIPGLAYWYGGRSWLNTLPGDGYGRTVVDEDRSVCGAAVRCVRNAVRPVAEARVVADNRLDWSLLPGFDEEYDSLFFTGGRGCPGACTFCAKLHGQEVRAKPAKRLLEEIEAADALVAEGALRLSRWELFKHVDAAELRDRQVSWAAVFDEDFFLHRRRAIQFFRLWDRSPLKIRYRLSVQTNPCSMLTSSGDPHADLMGWIDRVKPMIQLGAESFHQELLSRWRKRHTVEQLETVLDALDGTGQDYTVFQLLTDFDSTAEELLDTLRLLILSAFRHRRMRIASSPFTIPLYDSDTRRLLEYRSDPVARRAGHFTDFERPQPGWMDPLVAELAELADSELQWTLNPEQREGALVSAMETVVQRLRAEPRAQGRVAALRRQAEHALEEIREARFRAVVPSTASDAERQC